MVNRSDQTQPAVRFSSVQQEIPPDESMQHAAPSRSEEREEDFPLEAKQEIRSLAMSLQNGRLQNKRMEDFTFEPVSLPVSRVPSGSSSNINLSGAPSPQVGAVHSPPLTPAASGGRDGKPVLGHVKHNSESQSVPPPTSIPSGSQEFKPSSAAQARLPKSPGLRPSSMYEGVEAVPSHPKHPPAGSFGPTGDSLPPSHDGSPAGTPRPGTPNIPAGAQSPYPRPFSPHDDHNNPYARAKRPPQPQNLNTIDPRFVFARERPKSPFFMLKDERSRDSKGSEKRSIFGSGSKHDESDSGKRPTDKHHHHGSMTDLKRFFKIGGKKDKDKEKRESSPVGVSAAGTRTPPSIQRNGSALPFADDHGIESKYGKFGKILGSGAGGSVRLMKRSSDGVTFAVKQFRDRHSYESEKEYNKKVTAEFCIGSTLHHGNIIETMDIVYEKGKWFEVMEYAPFDLFAIVMTGKMSREEIGCSTLQILNGVCYLHSMGLAHRDLKLDNVVVNEHGIMKIIDFGSAVVFQYPFENEIVLASGIVGSDPYLAPEVYDLPKYDPQPTDIWSLAIIFCCMTLRRFPWKMPRVSDNSYKLFISEPTEEELRSNVYPHDQRSPIASSESASRQSSDPSNPRSHRRGKSEEARSEPVTRAPTDDVQPAQPAPPTVLKGPWRLLRLLPRETRHIIGRMLEVDPRKRATLEEILSDQWVRKTLFCMQDPSGKVLRAEGHTHTLEPGSGQAPAPAAKK
ncbi:Pkinase-domain-containing protein [Trichodelitschia bisporula]|uniref:non-specific serine/threonine protein kinase n=1 Tax=Trichodelitschia bisporula TaxID=703511 RepID=A0A6G1HLH3_9PEZI|nr:Pkinase-domain-containing protein [Trichodelitschia bisporula]